MAVAVPVAVAMAGVAALAARRVLQVVQQQHCQEAANQHQPCQTLWQAFLAAVHVTGGGGGGGRVAVRVVVVVRVVVRMIVGVGIVSERLDVRVRVRRGLRGAREHVDKSRPPPLTRCAAKRCPPGARCTHPARLCKRMEAFGHDDRQGRANEQASAEGGHRLQVALAYTHDEGRASRH